MLKLSAALAGWSPRAHGKSHDPLVLLEAVWSEIVGPQVAANSHPASIAGGTLVVIVRSSVWAHQMSFLAEQVLRAVAARLPAAGIERLRFRVGSLARRRTFAAPAPMLVGRRKDAARSTAATADEALTRLRLDVEARARAKRSAGWKECKGCAALLAPEADVRCPSCAAASAGERSSAAARLLFEAPWLGYAGTAALVDGLKEMEYERVRNRLLTRWWEVLAQTRAHKRLSRDGRERLIASSYVVLKSQLSPEKIMPATVRTVLGDELMDLLYGGTKG